MNSKREEKIMSCGFAPYNFIPTLEGEAKQDVVSRDEVPAFNEAPDGTLTGHIDYDLCALSNLHIGSETSGKNEKKKSHDEVRSFFRNGERKLAIPGSTMRGFVRSHAELLSGSYSEFVTDEYFLYRKFASKCTSVRDEYSNRMTSEIRRNNAKKNQKKTGNSNAQPSVIRVLDDVKAGYLVNKDGRYSIIPVQEFGDTGTTFFRVHEADLQKYKKLKNNQYMYTEQLTNGTKPDNSKKSNKYRPYRGVKTTFAYYSKSHSLNLNGQGESGVLLNSSWINGKTHHYLVSAAKKNGSGSIPIPLELAVSYMDDYKRNCIQNKRLEKESYFYALPEKGQEKLFFYKVKKENGIEKLIGFGPTPYFRIFYDHNLRDGLAVKQGSGLDYTEAVFGYTGNSESLKSRVYFENCVADKVPDTKKVSNVSLTLIGPKATSFPMYVSQKADNSDMLPVEKLRTYNADSFKLNGYKFYWKRSKAMESMVEVEKSSEYQKENSNIQSKLEVVKATKEEPMVFHGRIDFENLKPEELGMLLMSLRLQDEAEPESYLIGSGKPYGMGRVDPKNIHLYCMDQKERFLSVSPREEDCTDQINTYKRKFLDTMDQDYTQSSMYKTYLAMIRQDNADYYLNKYDGETAWSDPEDKKHMVYMPLDSRTSEVPDYKACLPLEPAWKILGMEKSVPTEVRDQNNGKGYRVLARLSDGTEGGRCYENRNTKNKKSIKKSQKGKQNHVTR